MLWSVWVLIRAAKQQGTVTFERTLRAPWRSEPSWKGDQGYGKTEEEAEGETGPGW